MPVKTDYTEVGNLLRDLRKLWGNIPKKEMARLIFSEDFEVKSDPIKDYQEIEGGRRRLTREQYDRLSVAYETGNKDAVPQSKQKQIENLLSDLYLAVEHSYDKPIDARFLVNTPQGSNTFAPKKQSFVHHSESLPLVGRSIELKRAKDAWYTTSSEYVSFIVIKGEGGIGKSKLSEVLCSWFEDQKISTVYARCMKGDMSYAPLLTWLSLDTFKQSIASLDNFSRVELARIQPNILRDYPDLQHPSPFIEESNELKRRLFSSLVHSFDNVNRPIVFVMDDFHRCDTGTLDWLYYRLQRKVKVPTVFLITVRNEELEDPIAKFLQQIDLSGHSTEIELHPLSFEETTELAKRMLGKKWQEETAQDIFNYTGGNPFFVIEGTLAGVDFRHENILNQHPFDILPQSANRLPPKLQSMIRSRLDPLKTSRNIANMACVFGRSFTVDLLISTGKFERTTLVEGLDELERYGIVKQIFPNNYEFTHDRIVDSLYSDLSGAKRTDLHRSAAAAYEKIYGKDLDLEGLRLAEHYKRGGQIEEAISIYQRVHNTALCRFQSEEAIRVAEHAIDLLKELPNLDIRRQLEIDLRIQIGMALSARSDFGSSKIEDTFLRAYKLYHESPKISEQRYSQILSGLATMYFVRGDLRGNGERYRQELIVFAQQSRHPSIIAAASAIATSFHFFTGEFASAHKYGEQGADTYDPQTRHEQYYLYSYDPSLSALVYLAMTEWCMGKSETALNCAKLALKRAELHNHRGTIAWVRNLFVVVLYFRRDVDSLSEQVDLAIKEAEEWGLAQWLAHSAAFKGWALFQQQKLGAIEEIQQSIDKWQNEVGDLGMPAYLMLFADVLLAAGRNEEALEKIAKGFSISERSGEKGFVAEFYRLRGEALRQLGEHTQAETSFDAAIKIAKSQEAKAWELRATISLARLSLKKGNFHKAHATLFSIYSWFKEGHDTVDLLEAKELLDELSLLTEKDTD